jgi:hypothetical protein
MIVGSDIDGLISAMMLASVAGWRIVAMVTRSNTVLVESGQQDLRMLTEATDVVGVDLYSPLFPTFSNHPVLFGTPKPRRPEWLRDLMRRFDEMILRQTQRFGSINLSIWAGVGAELGYSSPRGFPYKYPLGTAQVLLAALEVAGRPPRFYDRQYLPWLVADCDGGLESIRRYHWNVEIWWPALAAVAGPASRSEAVYRLASTQRPTEVVDVDLRLRQDYRMLSSALNPDWNLADNSVDTVIRAISLLRELSGWPDPFEGGVDGIRSWRTVEPTRNLMRMDGLNARARPVTEAHLRGAAEAVHVNFSRFPERGTALGWMARRSIPEIEAELGGGPEVSLIPESINHQEEDDGEEQAD